MAVLSKPYYGTVVPLPIHLPSRRWEAGHGVPEDPTGHPPSASTQLHHAQTGNSNKAPKCRLSKTQLLKQARDNNKALKAHRRSLKGQLAANAHLKS
eukprot:jgi/Chrzof1/5523/Cz16g06080.t1